MLEAMLEVASFVRSRLPVIAALAILLGGLTLGVHRYHHLPQAWEAFGLPALNIDFADTRTITHSIDCLLSGRDPYVERSFDPWHRLYNYPPIWLQLRHLGVRSTTTKWIGGLFAAAFFGSCFALFRARNWITGGIIFLALLSWPVLFALERGNNDLVIFSILTAGALWIERRGRRFVVLKRALLIVLMTVLKIYPVVTALALVRSRKLIWKAIATAVVAILALAATSGSKLLPTLRNTPQEYMFSFGSLPVSKTIHNLVHPNAPAAAPQHVLLTAIALALVGIVVGLFGRDSLLRGLPHIDLYSARGFIAAAGLTIYGCIFFTGSSFDYRLIFLLCPLMYLIEELNARVSIAPLATALVLLFFLWSFRIGPHALKELLDGLIFIGTCAWLTDTMRRALALGSGTERTESLRHAASVS